MSQNDVINQPAEIQPEIPKELIEAGVFYGRMRNSTNPKMKHYIVANRNGIEIINPLKVLEDMERALGFVKEKMREGGLALFVGTQPPAEAAITAIAREFQMPYVVRRWVGGTLTNYKVIAKRVEHLKKLKEDMASGALQKYTKKERLTIEREMKRLEELLGGLATMLRLPDVLIIIDPKLHMAAVREARLLGIPVLTLANVDSDPDILDYLVVGNNQSRKSIEWFLSKVREAVREGIAARAAEPAQDKAAGSQ